MGSTSLIIHHISCSDIFFRRDTLFVYRGIVSTYMNDMPVCYLTFDCRPIHQNIKEKIVASTEQDTIHIFRTLHNTARVYKNKVALEVVAIEKRGNAKFEDV